MSKQHCAAEGDNLPCVSLPAELGVTGDHFKDKGEA